MFTNNMIKLMRHFAFSYYRGSSTSGFVGVNGTTRSAGGLYMGSAGIAYHMRYAYCSAFSDTGTGSSGVYFGTGSTPATVSDYKLESPITSGLNIINTGSTLEEHIKDGVWTLMANYSVQNTTESELNIYEIGLFSRICSSTDDEMFSSVDVLYPILVERTVLDEPITIPAGQTKLVTYKLTFNQTLNVE